MSDFSQGEGWWQASDGKWHPPETAAPYYAASTSGAPAPSPMAAPPAAPAPKKSGLGTGPIVGIVVAVVVVIGAIAFVATSGDSKKKAASSSSSGAPAVDAPAGFTVFASDRDVFALAVPSSFEIADLTSSDPDRAVSEATAKNPAFANFDSQIRNVMNNRGKMFAVDLSGDGFADNLTLIEAPEFDITTASGKASLKTQIESFGGSNVGFSTQTFHGRKVLVAVYDLPVTGADGSQRSAFGGQAYAPAGGSVWILTLTSSTPTGPDFDTIVKTFDVND